jgi:hypothetical protein
MAATDLAPALESALRRTAEAMAQQAVRTAVAGLGERRHLLPAFTAALRDAMADVDVAVEVSTEHRSPLGTGRVAPASTSP